MRQKCTKERSSRPDSFFVNMVQSVAYSWMPQYHAPNLDDKYDFDDDEEEDDEYEDEITRANEQAGFYFDDDGEFHYTDDADEEGNW